MKPRPKRHYRGMNRAKAEDVRFLYFTRRLKQREIAEIHGIKQNTVSRIVSGMVWA